MSLLPLSYMKIIRFANTNTITNSDHQKVVPPSVLQSTLGHSREEVSVDENIPIQNSNGENLLCMFMEVIQSTVFKS